MKRILFFETTTFTGATRVTRTIAKKISGRFEVRTAIISDIKKPRKEIEESIERERPDILFSSFSMINPDVILVGKEKNLIVVVRSDYNFKDLSIETQERILETYTKADWIIAQTPEMKDDLLSKDALKGCRIKVIENPLDEEDILLKALEPNPFPDIGCFHFLWVGRKNPIKDLPTLRKAFDIVHKLNPNTDLTLISNDSNPYHWIKNADCLVISSISEASPNVLKEALFLGTSVISTDCSPTVRKHLPSERIVNVGNEEALAHAMVRIIREKRENNLQ